MSSEFKFPTEVVDLPSKGLLYPEDHPLASGQVEIKYMTAKEEDILTNQNYLAKGIVVDKLLQSLVVTKFNFNDLLSGDKNAILLASRILGYGKDYEFEYAGIKYTVDLSEIEHKEIDYSIFEGRKNEFEYNLPSTNNAITFKLLTQEDQNKIDREIEGLKKIKKGETFEVSTRMKHMITSVNGDSTDSAIRSFVDNAFLARDARAFRKHVESITPDVDLRFFPDNAPEDGVEVPIGVTFLWPDARI